MSLGVTKKVGLRNHPRNWDPGKLIPMCRSKLGMNQPPKGWRSNLRAFHFGLWTRWSICLYAKRKLQLLWREISSKHYDFFICLLVKTKQNKTGILVSRTKWQRDWERETDRQKEIHSLKWFQQNGNTSKTIYEWLLYWYQAWWPHFEKFSSHSLSLIHRIN